MVWIAVGAAAGGMIVGSFQLPPLWMWGAAGGAMGGLLGAAAGHLGKRRWPVAVRALAICAVLGGGYFALWMFAGYWFVMEAARRTIGG